MFGLWKFFLDKHHFTALLAAVLIAAGFIAALAIPKESAPEVQVPIGVITAILPGASAEDVERLITNPIEDRVIGVERVSKVTSSSGDGVSSITVEFDAQADIEKSIQLLKDEVDKVGPELPSEAEDPSVTDVNFADQPILIASIAGNLAPAELTAIGESVQEELERVPGVSSVALSGVRAREVHVVVSQARLAQYDLALSDVTNAIRSAGLASPIGSITVDGIQYAVRLEAEVASPEDVGAVAIARPGEPPLYVRDVADVVDGLEDVRSVSRVSVDGAPSEPALTLSVFKSRGGNIVATGDRVLDKLHELEDGVLAGTELVVTYDAAEYVRHDLAELTRVGFETMFLVMLILFATLGWRESLVAGLSIPLSFLIAFIGLYASGNTINFVSLFSLILAIGILVDSGIVVVEAIHTRLIRYGDKRRAALESLKEYSWPLIAGTFTTVAVFVPLFFLSGITGKFIASIPFTVIFVLVASIFVALGLIPLIALALIRPNLSRIEKIQEEWNDRARHWYERQLRRLFSDRKLENRFLFGLGILFVIALLSPMFGFVKVIFFPGENGDLLFVELSKPVGTELAATDFSVREVEEILYENPDIASFVAEVGTGSLFGSGGAGARIANVSINLEKERAKTSAEIAAEIREDLAAVTSARVTVSEPESGPPTGTPVVITFVGSEFTDLQDAVETGEQILRDIPGTVNVNTSARDDSAEFVISLDSGKAALAGVSAGAVADTLRTALFGAEATDIRAGGEDIEVRVRLDLNPSYEEPQETTHVTIDAVRALLVPSVSGASVPLSSVADISYEPANAVIRHEDGLRVMTLTSELAGAVSPYEVTAQFAARMENEVLPGNVTMSVGGETEDVNQTFTEMFLALIAGIALMLAILVLEFNSFRHASYLLLTIPLSLIGVFAGLALTQQPLSFPSLLGVIALAGVIINHAIILMDSIARIGKDAEGKTLTDVVVEAAATRFRPIILTTVTTVVGMIPLSIASALWGPLAFSIMFGLTFAMVLTLILIPVLYHRWPGKAIRARFNGNGHPQPTLPPAQDPNQLLLP